MLKNSVVLFLKGFLMGCANLIPGVSGGTLAVILGIYDRFINVLGHFVSDFKKNASFILPVIFGMVTALVSLSGVITHCLTFYLFPTVLFFFGAILGGIPMILKKLNGAKPNVPNIICFVAAFLLVMLPLAFTGKNVNFDNLNLFLIFKIIAAGTIASATMVIPGVSGSAVLMAMGYYMPIMTALHGLTDMNNFLKNAMIIFPYAIGLILGMLLVARGIEYLLNNFTVKSFYGILGFVISSAIVVLGQNHIFSAFRSTPPTQIILGFVLLIFGFISAYKLGEKN
ncbi:MAG: DUF368 domain-containing protein [Oscillospiraceae bacterium]